MLQINPARPLYLNEFPLASFLSFLSHFSILFPRSWSEKPGGIIGYKNDRSCCDVANRFFRFFFVFLARRAVIR